MKRGTVFVWTLVLASAYGLAVVRVPSSQTTATYVGSETCKDCHAAQWEQFQTNVHGRIEGDPAVAERTGCESCHGPGSMHAAAGGDRSDPGFATIRSFARMTPDQASETCMGCHRGGERFYWEHGSHARRGVSCVGCHSIHHAKTTPGEPMLKAVDVNRLCTTCHRDKRHALARSAHMPLREGSMDCADCHNPHGSPTRANLRATSVNELCLQCHADKRGPMLWEHAPVRENCLNCHQPHGSNNAKVLASKEPFLCQRCHIQTRHPSTLYDRPDLVSNRLVNRSCTNCHSQVHGSNHPSGKTFLR